MLKTERLLFIYPPYELIFKGPFTQPVHTIMILKNPCDKKVAFKIKTSEPKLYCVRVNSCELAPKEKAEILVKLQPFRYDANGRNKHKFLVQAVVIDPVADYGEDGKTFQWRNVEKSRIMDYKIKCSFEMPSDEGLLESKNIHEDTTVVPEVNAETELQKAATEVKESREKNNKRKYPESIILDPRIFFLNLKDRDYPGEKCETIVTSEQLLENRKKNVKIMKDWLGIP